MITELTELSDLLTLVAYPEIFSLLGNEKHRESDGWSANRKNFAAYL